MPSPGILITPSYDPLRTPASVYVDSLSEEKAAVFVSRSAIRSGEHKAVPMTRSDGKVDGRTAVSGPALILLPSPVLHSALNTAAWKDTPQS